MRRAGTWPAAPNESWPGEQDRRDAGGLGRRRREGRPFYTRESGTRTRCPIRRGWAKLNRKRQCTGNDFTYKSWRAE